MIPYCGLNDMIYNINTDSDTCVGDSIIECELKDDLLKLCCFGVREASLENEQNFFVISDNKIQFSILAMIRTWLIQ